MRQKVHWDAVGAGPSGCGNTRGAPRQGVAVVVGEARHRWFRLVTAQIACW
jgi:hypothetical protein